MADKILFDNNDLAVLLTELKKAFPLKSALATINGNSLVNAGIDIKIDDSKCVLFFEGPVNRSSGVKNETLAIPTGVYFNSASNCFVATGDNIALSPTNIYSNWTGADDWGDPGTGGRAPVKSKLYIERSTKRLYHWDGSKLVDLTFVTTLYEVVTTLPTASAETMNKIYIVASSNTAEGNKRAEYVTVQPTSTTYEWEKLGEVGADINLANYITSSQLTTALNNYYTKTQAGNTFLTQTNAASTYMKKTDYAYTVMTEAEVKAAVTAAFGNY